jgi:serine/threonine-protein kinase
MAPEQVSGAALTDRVDVYAAGILLFTLLTGQHPFEGDTSRDVLAHQLLTTPPDVSSIDPQVPRSLARLVALCLEKDPTRRPSASVLGAQLRAVSDELGAPPLLLSPHPVTAERTAVEGLRRHERPTGTR